MLEGAALSWLLPDIVIRRKERHCRDRTARTDNELTRAGGGLLSADPIGLRRLAFASA
jgi:hypothetical protein